MRFSKYSKTRGQYETLEARQLFAADLAQDDYLITNCRAELDGIANQMSLMQSFSYNGVSMRKNDTSVAGGPDSVQSIPDRMTVQGVLSFENGPVVTGGKGGGAVDHNSTRSNNGIVGEGGGGAVDHNSTRSNNGIVGEGGEQHKIYDYSQCIWNDITFNCHATPDANLRGSVTVNLVNVKDQYQTDTCHVDEYGTVSMAFKVEPDSAGDQYQTDTCHVDEYGTISMAFKVEPDSKDWIDRVKDQYEGSLAGAKPNGAVILSDRSGNDTVNWNINGWHIENFSVDQVMSELGGQEPGNNKVPIRQFITLISI